MTGWKSRSDVLYFHHRDPLFCLTKDVCRAHFCSAKNVHYDQKGYFKLFKGVKFGLKSMAGVWLRSGRVVAG
jgi:hypothetical protein